MQPPLYSEYEDISDGRLRGVTLPASTGERLLHCPPLPVRLTVSTNRDANEVEKEDVRFIHAPDTVSFPTPRRGGQAKVEPTHAGRQQARKRMVAGPSIRLHEITTLFSCENAVPESTRISSSVELYVYDLSFGLLEKHSEKLLGSRTPGVYHSSIVCFGLEFFFEGGINRMRSGSTRFGSKFFRVPMGATTKHLHEFWAWVEDSQRSVFKINDYHIMKFNCHHFSQAAVDYLIGSGCRIPQFLRDTSDYAFSTELGKLAVEIIQLHSFGIQSSITRKSLKNLVELNEGLIRLNAAAHSCQIKAAPADTVVCFRVCDKKVCQKSFQQVLPYLNDLHQRNILSAGSLSAAKEFIDMALSACPTWESQKIYVFVDAVVGCLLSFPIVLWGPLLNSLRLVVLNRAALCVVVHHPRVLSLIFLAANDFPRLSCDGKIGLLRLIANFSSSINGAVVLSNYNNMHRWTSVIGLGLMDKSDTVQYTAACLAMNIAVAVKHCNRACFLDELCTQSRQHPVLRLVSVLLYNAHPSTQRSYTEATLNMLLTAVLHIKSTSICSAQFVDCHKYKLDYTYLIYQCQSSETASLLFLIRSL